MSETLSQKGKVSWTDFPGKPVNWDFELRRERFEKNPAQTNSGISFFFCKIPEPCFGSTTSHSEF